MDRHAIELSRKYEKQGYLVEDYRMFHLKDRTKREHQYHYHDFYKVLLFISGNATYIIEGKSYKLKPYDTVLVNQYDIHKPQVEYNAPYERIIFYISREYLDRHMDDGEDLFYCFKYAKEKGSNVVRFPAIFNSRLMEIIRQMEENEREERFGARLLSKTLFMEYLILLNRAVAEEACSFERNASYNQKTIDIITYINEHLDEELTIDDLAEHFYISRYYMMRLFKEETGYSIHQYIVEKRVLKAKLMMSSGISATKACFECGFRDYSTFSRAFRSKLGVNPSEI